MRRAHHRAGFTLVELLGATALAAVLMVAVLSVVVSIARTRQQTLRNQRHTAWPEVLVWRLAADLTCARQVEAAGNRITLTGFGALDPVTLVPLHRPAKVLYLIQSDGQRSWLVRRQVLLDEPTNANVWAELVCPDVASITLKDVKLPAQVTLVLQSSDGKTVPLERTIVLE